MYKFSISGIKTTDNLKDISFTNFELTPQYEKYRFVRLVGHQTDCFRISIPELIFKNFDVALFLKEKALHVEEIRMESPTFDIFRDKNIPRDMKVFPPMPQEALKKVSMPLMADTIVINKSTIIYTEHESGAEEAGSVFFKPANLMVTGLNNNPDFFGAKGEFFVYMTASFMGHSTARAKVGFSLLGDSSDITFSGTLDPVELSVFNAITVQNGRIRINSGRAGKLFFEFKATRTTSRGIVEFFYDNLDFTILKQNDEGGHKERRFLSFIAGQIIRNSNTPEGNKAYIAHVDYHRDMNKGVINFIWKSILEGIKATVTPGTKNLERK